VPGLSVCVLMSSIRISLVVVFTVTGTFAPKNFRSRERKFQELSLPGTFVPWNYRSLSKCGFELGVLQVDKLVP